jgi:hypothetical protein
MGKKGSGYGEFQKNDALGKVIKIRSDDGEVIGTMSGYEPIDEKTGKRKARQYKSGNIKKFNISELTFLKSFIEVIDKVCFIWLKAYLQETLSEREK